MVSSCGSWTLRVLHVLLSVNWWTQQAAHGGMLPVMKEIEVTSPPTTMAHSSSADSLLLSLNATYSTRNLKRNVHRAPSPEQRDEVARQRRRRLQQRRSRARETLATLSQTADSSPTSPVQRLTQEEVDRVHRRTSWFGNGDGYSYNAALGYLADPSQEYDKWAQAYRMLGAFIDCDHQKREGSGDHNNNNNNNNNNNGDGEPCSRWMMWAAVSFIRHLQTTNQLPIN
jgi:hypothetical protein